MGACLKVLAGRNHTDQPIQKKGQSKELQEERQQLPPPDKQQKEPEAAPFNVQPPAPRLKEQPVPEPSVPPTPEAAFKQFSQGKEELPVEDAQDFFAQLKFPLDQGVGLIAFYLLHAESFQALRAVEVQQYCRE